MVVISAEYQDAVRRIVCTIGRLIVLAGAIFKGRSEIREMANVGIRKYFQTTVSFSVSDVYHESYMLLFLTRVLLFLKIV
jgi:hypothetical protein